MKVDPYIPLAERKRLLWEEAARLLGTTPEEATQLYIQIFCTTMGNTDFLDCLRRNKFTPEQIKDYKSRVKPSTPITPEEQKNLDLVSECLFELDREDYECKQIIEVGDEVQAKESQFYSVSKKMYLTQWLWYKVRELKSEGLTDFTAITDSNFPNDPAYLHRHHILAIRRNGKVVWEDRYPNASSQRTV